MNLPNKITITRIILSVCMLILLIFPWYQVGIEFPRYTISGTIVVDLKYIIGGLFFVIAAVTDFIDGHIARKYNLVTDFGKVMDAIADKILVNGLLIILACNGFISVVVPVVIITRDIFVDSIKMVAGNKKGAVGASLAGKAKTVCMLVGLSLVMFYNLPFELWNIRVADILILAATVLSVISGCQYYINNKELLKHK